LRAVFFDFDNTLHDYSGAYARAFESAAAPMCTGASGSPDPTELRRRCEEPWRHTWQRFMARQIDDARLWTERSAAVVAAAGIPPNPHLAAAFHRAFVATMEREIRLFGDVEPCLQVLEALQPRLLLGVLTNGPWAIQQARIRHLGLEARCPVIVISGALGCSKPASAFFREALRRAGAAPPEAVMIGDNPETDIAGAKAAGLAAIFLDRVGAGWSRSWGPEPDAVASDLRAATAWVVARVETGTER
jgi:putative hydrolase of the HAD superfamily